MKRTPPFHRRSRSVLYVGSFPARDLRLGLRPVRTILSFVDGRICSMGLEPTLVLRELEGDKCDGRGETGCAGTV